MMNSGSPKENENPTIYAVSGESKRKSVEGALKWEQMGSFRPSSALPSAGDADDIFGSSADEGPQLWGCPSTAEDRSVLKAIMDASKCSAQSVSLLRSAGLTIPSSVGDTFRRPHFEPASASATKPKAPKKTSHEKITASEVFEIVRNVQDPEHPHTLEQLGVVCLDHVFVHDGQDASQPNGAGNQSVASVRFTPTIPHCSMATLIGLSLTVKLIRSLPSRFSIYVQIQPGTHASELAINKQLRDKERICAALENKHLASVVNKCIKSGMEQ